MKDLIEDSSCDAIRWGSATYRTLIPAEASGGALSMVLAAEDALTGPPRHVHHAEDESFYVVSGEVEFWLAGRTFRKGAGEAAFVPRGTEHTFRTLTDARMLIILTPGGFEGFFADMARGGFRIPEDMGAIAESAARHNLTFTGPPLGVG